MKKRIASIVLAAACALSLGACGTTTTSTSTTASSTASKAASSTTAAPTSAAPTPTAAPTGYTADQFNQITMGMTYDQVKQIMGGEGSVSSETDISGVKSTVYLWSNPDGLSNITVSVGNGVVDSKAQTNIISTGNVATLAKFNQVQTGMTLDQVNGIMGAAGALMSETSAGGVQTDIYAWDADLGSNCTITFQSGAVASKAQIGLS